SAQAAGQTSLESLEAVIDAQIEKMINEEVTDVELTKAKNAIIKSLRLGITDPLGFSMHLTEAIAVADWRWWLAYPEKIEQVTKDDIKAVMKKYLYRDNRTVGYYYPKPESAEKAATQAAEDASEKSASPTDQEISIDSSKESIARSIAESIADSSEQTEQTNSSSPAPAIKIRLADRVIKKKLENGLTILTLPIEGSNTIAISGKIKAGSQFVSHQKSQISSFVASMLSSGSSKYSKEALADQLEIMGTHLDFHASTFWTEFNTEVVSEDLNDIADLIADALQNPTFPDKELSIEKKLRESDLKESMADTGDLAWNALVRQIYKPSSPFYEKTFKEQIAELSKISRTDLIDFHKKYYGPDQTVLSFAGDITAEIAESLCRKAFASWKQTTPVEYKLTASDVNQLQAPEQVLSSIPGKANVDIKVGKALPVSFHCQDYFATVIANAALGYDSFACRLAPVRDKYGLTYGIYSVIDDPTTMYGPWFIKYSVNPDNIERAQTIVKSIVD
ncbi:MAG: insulinase family protein, partial [Candidatus Obscuribacterales bacterium]|nr:insulinase family protein [Candidatus Obscuribacterales bacterium]